MRGQPNFQYNFYALSASRQRFPEFIQRALDFPNAHELAKHVGETNAGDYLVASVARRLDIGGLIDAIIEGEYEEKLALKLQKGAGEALLFAFPMIGDCVRMLNVHLGASKPGRALMLKLVESDIGRTFSTSLIIHKWDWASRIYLDLSGDEDVDQSVKSVAYSTGGQELARLLGATEPGISFLRTTMENRNFLEFSGKLLKSDSHRRFLIDFCGSSAVAKFVNSLIEREGASELLQEILESQYVTDVLAPLQATGDLNGLLEDVVDSAKRTSLAEKIASALRVAGRDSSTDADLAHMLLPTFTALMVKIWLAGMGVVVTVQLVYVAAVIAVTERAGTTGNKTANAGVDEVWIPHSAHETPPPDSNSWRKVIGARLDKTGVPAFFPTDLEKRELLSGAIYRYLATKDVRNPTPSYQDQVFIGMLMNWYIDLGNMESDNPEGARLHKLLNLLYSGLADIARRDPDQLLAIRQLVASQTGRPINDVRISDLADKVASEAGVPLSPAEAQAPDEPPAWLASLEETIRNAVKGSTKDRWINRLDSLLVSLAAAGIGAAIADAVAALMRLAPYAEAQIYEIDSSIARNLDHWRQVAKGENLDAEWTPEDDLALIYCVHAMSVIAICGAYTRHGGEEEGALAELFTPARRMNHELLIVHAQNLGGTNIFTG